MSPDFGQAARTNWAEVRKHGGGASGGEKNPGVAVPSDGQRSAQKFLTAAGYDEGDWR
jgi:hypothetical protein